MTLTGFFSDEWSISMYLSITDFIAQVSLFFSKFPEDSKDAILKPVQYIK